MAKTVAQLQEEAKALLEQAKKVESANSYKVGRWIIANIDSVTLPEIKAYVKAVIAGEETQKKSDGKKPAAETKHPAEM